MAIELDEEFFLLTEAPRHIPGRPHVSTVWRWVGRGVRGYRLETIAVGGRVFTTRQAIQRFLDAQNGDRLRSACATKPASANYELQIAEAANTLRQAGIAHSTLTP